MSFPFEYIVFVLFFATVIWNFQLGSWKVGPEFQGRALDKR